MIYFSSKKLENFFNLIEILKFLLYLIPISLILGNFAVNLNSLFIIFTLFLIISYDKNFFTYYKKIFFIFYFFLIIIIFNIIFSENINLSIVSSLGIIRYFFVMLGILYCLENDDKFLYTYSKYLSLIILFVAGDTLFQYFIAKLNQI